MGEMRKFPQRKHDGVAMYCAECGADCSIPNVAADPGPCKCGATMKVSAPLVGKVSVWHSNGEMA